MAQPTFDEFLSQAKPLNPGYSDEQIRSEYDKAFPTTTPSAPSAPSGAPSLDEFLSQAKPLNPGYSDEQITEQYHLAYGAPAKPKGFGESFVSGMQQGVQELGASASGTIERLQAPGDPLKGLASDTAKSFEEAARQYAPPDQLQSQPWYDRLRNPEYLGNLMGNVIVQSAPSLAGAAVGGVLGGPAGAAAGMVAVTYFQQAGQTYREAYERYTRDGLSETEAHEKAYTTSGLAGLVSGVVNALAVPASLVAPFTSKLKNLALNYVANVAVDTGDQATQNILAKATYKPEQELTAGIPEAVVGSALLSAPETIGTIKTFAPRPVIPPAPEKTPEPIAPILQAETTDQAIVEAQKAVETAPISTSELDTFIKAQTDHTLTGIEVGGLEAQDAEDRAALAHVLSFAGETSEVTTDERGNVFYQGAPLDILSKTSLPDTAPPEGGLSKEKYDALQAIAGTMGKRIVFYADRETLPSGVTMKSQYPAIIFMSGKAQGTDFFSVFAHEALHLHEGTPFHEAFRNVIWANLTPDAKKIALERHGELPHDALLNEIAADVQGTELHKPEVWEKVYRELEARHGEATAKTEVLGFIDTIKDLIARVKDLILSRPFASRVGGMKKTFAEQYITNLTKVHEALAAGVADAIYNRQGSRPDTGKMALKKKPTAVAREIVHPAAVEKFSALASAQRGAPEMAMLKVQKAVGGGVMNPVVEHVGDLIHRMTEMSQYGEAQQENVASKVERALSALTHPYGFEKEHHENLRNNARYDHKPVAEVRAAVDAALLAYAKEHKKLPAYNRPQWLAREAAVAVGEQRFEDAIARLKELQKIVKSKDFGTQAFEFTKGKTGEPTVYTPEEKKPKGEKPAEKAGEKPAEKPSPISAKPAEKGPSTQPAEKEEFDYASTQIDLAPALAKKVLAIAEKIPDKDLAEKGRETDPHITVKYGLHSEDPSQAAALLRGVPPVQATIGDLTVFEIDEADVLVLAVESPPLVELNATLTEKLENTTEFAYQPHITVAYVKPGLGKGYAESLRNPLKNTIVRADTISFSNKQGEKTAIPLGQPKFAPRAAALSLASFQYGEALTKDTIFYRTYTGFDHEKGTTAADVVRFEAETYGNEDSKKVPKSILKELKSYPASQIVWVTKRREDAARYGANEESSKKEQREALKNVDEVLAPKGSRVIVPDDGDGGLLVLLNTTQRPAFAPRTATLEHYSRQEGLREISPTFHGTGQIGAERTRMLNEGKAYLPRTYFYRAGAKPETRFKGLTKYTAQVPESQLVDLATLKGTPTEREQAAKKAGYLGFYNSESSMPDAVALFEPVSVGEQPRFSPRIWFSAMGNMLAAKMPANASKEQVQNLLKSPGIKDDEVKWTGIQDYLDAQKGPINKHNLLKWLDDRGLQLGETLQPQAVGELAKDIFGREMASMMSLEVVDGGVMAALHYDQVQEAVISGLPVDVVDEFARVQSSPEDLFRNPDVVMPLLSVDHRRSVSTGVLASARRVSADLRTKLNDAQSRGSDIELYPTLSASDLTSREVVGFLSPESIYHVTLPISASESNVTTARTELAQSNEFRRIHKETISAHLADTLNWHNTIVSEASISKQEQPKFAPRTRPSTYPVSQPSTLDYIERVLRDKNVDIKRIVEAIQSSGRAVPEGLNPVLAEEMFQKRDEQRARDFTNDELRPLIDAMRMAKVTIPQLDTYLHARHVIDDRINARLQAINPDLAQSPNFNKLSGITDAEAQNILNNSNRAIMDPLARRVDDIVETTRELMVQYGLEKQSTIDEWRKTYTHYVPLHREGFDEDGHPTGTGKSVRGSTVKERGGSGLDVVNILANLAQTRDQIVTRGEKNRVTTAMAGLMMLHPNPNIATLDKPAAITIVNPQTGLPTIVPGNLTNYQVPTIRRFNPVLGRMQTYPDPMYKGRDNVVNFRVNGEDYAIVFNEQSPRAMEAAKAFKNLGTPQLNGIMKLVAPYTRYLAAINTQYNPIFGIVNFVRDAQYAMLTLSSTPLNGKQATVFTNAIASLNGIYQDARAVRKGQQVNSMSAQMWRRFEHVGGPTGYRDLFFSASERAAELERLMDPTSWKGTYNPQKFGKRIEETPLFKWLSDYNLMMENAIRLGVFKTAVDNGMSDLMAASLAKNITVNFNKKGQIGAQMGSLYAFFNANVQGTARILETLFERTPTGVRISSVGKKIITGGLLLGVLQTFALTMAGFDDDDPPEFVKQKNLVIPIPGSEKGYAMIPMPLGFNLLPTLGRLAAETMVNVVKGQPAHPFEKGAALIGSIWNTMSPLGGTGDPIQEAAPTVLDPFAALKANRDWSGRPIYKEDRSSLDPTPGHTRTHDTATIWARGLSKAINWATGGTDYVPGVLSPTPDQIDYLVQQATGGVGREISKGTQMAQSAYTGEEFPTHKVPLAGRFYDSATGSSAVRSRFYEHVKQANMAYNEFEGRARHHEPFSDYVKTHPEARFAKAAIQVQEDLGVLNKQKQLMIDRGANRDAIRLQEQKITGLMERFNNLVERAQNQ